MIVFTRFPVPGVTKTRLIPILGPEGAADLQRAMTEHTLREVRAARERTGTDVVVRHEGGDAAAMRRWLGDDLRLAPQGAGDLGERMSRAFEEAFAAGRARVALVGTDCPDLDAATVERALDELRRHDLVLGPASVAGLKACSSRSR